MRLALALSVALPTSLAAEVPDVVTDIAPVHSLVSLVMEGVGEPVLLLDGPASPHDYALRPSDARALQNADVLVWVGPELTPWLGEAVDTLNRSAASIGLLDVDGTQRLPARDAIVFKGDDHSHDADEHDHERGHADGHDHEHDDSVDPHAWLSISNARLWLDSIAETLSDADPANAGTYAANADAGRERLDMLEGRISERLQGAKVAGFAVYHDAFQYFETAFDLRTLTALSPSDATQPTAARAAALEASVESGDVACLFSEPQYADRAVKALGNGAVSVAVLDPLGSTLEPGPDLYFGMMEAIAEAVSDC